MTSIFKSAFGTILLLSLTIAAATMAQAETAAPPNAVVYFINLKDGDTVKCPFKIQFGLSGMGVAPAGVEKAEYWTSSSSDRRHTHSRAGEGTDSGGRPPSALRRWTNRNDADASARSSHAAARARRFVARSFNSPIVSPAITVDVK